jgi:hypothetical protein
MGILLMIKDAPLTIICILAFFGLLLLLAKMSKTTPKYRQREDLAKEQKIKNLKQELEKLEKKK